MLFYSSARLARRVAGHRASPVIPPRTQAMTDPPPTLSYSTSRPQRSLEDHFALAACGMLFGVAFGALLFWWVLYR